jgi:hypothetical protein
MHARIDGGNIQLLTRTGLELALRSLKLKSAYLQSQAARRRQLRTGMSKITLVTGHSEDMAKSTRMTRSGHGGTAFLVTSSAATMAGRRRCSAVSAVPRPRSGREALADPWKSRAGFGRALAIDGGVENVAERAACN